MSILSKPKIAGSQRFDLEDYTALLSGLCADSKLNTQKFWSANPLILNGFVTSGIGSNLASVTIADSALIAAGGSASQSWFVGASGSAPKVVSLQSGAKNYLELSLSYVGDNLLLKAFWDATSNGGAGGEFNQLVETIDNLEASITVSTSGFSGDANKVPLSIVETNGSGIIKTILDSRDLFFRLGQAQNETRNYTWSTRVEASIDITLSSITGSYSVGETVTIGGVETAEVVSFSSPVLKVKNLSANTFSISDSVVGGTSAASGTLDQAVEEFIGADKDVATIKDILDALMTEVKLVKGTSRWFENSNNSLQGVTQFLNSIITQKVVGASYSWDGSALSITDASVTPSNADQLAGLRILGNSQDLVFSRQDVSAGSAALSITDGDVLYVELPTSGNLVYSDSGVGSSNYKTISKSNFQSNDSNFWIAYREGDRVYVRGYGELQPGETAPISDPAKAELEAQITTANSRGNQDRTLKLIDGGTWDVSTSGTVLQWSAAAHIEIAGLLDTVNTIGIGAFSLPNIGSVLYVEVVRSGTATNNLTVLTSDVDALVPTDNTVIIARRTSKGILVGSSCFLLKAGEFLELDGAEAEITRLLGQLRLSPHETDVKKVRISGAETALLNGSLQSQLLGDILLDFTGAVIDFTTGVITKEDGSTPLGSDFTPFTVPVGDVFSYGVSLTRASLTTNGSQLVTVRVDFATASGATEAVAPVPKIKGEIKLGTVLMSNPGGTVSVNKVRTLGPGSGSGGGLTTNSVTLANAQVAATNVTDLLLDSTSNKIFELEYSVERRYQGGEDAAFVTGVGTGASGNIRSLKVQPDDKILIGGDFTAFDGNGNYVRFLRRNADGTDDLTFNSNVGNTIDNSVLAIEVLSGEVYIGGSFAVASANPVGRIAKYSAAGVLDATFLSNSGFGFGGAVYAIAAVTGGIIVGGASLTSYNAVGVNNVIKLSSTGILDTTFNTNIGSGPNAAINALAIQPDGKILVGGGFTDFNGTARNRLVRLNSDGTEDLVFNNALGTSFSQPVYTLAIQPDGKILVGGDFTDFNGTARNRLVRLNSDGTEDLVFNNALGTGFDLRPIGISLYSDNSIQVSGLFANFNGNARSRLVKLANNGIEDASFNAHLGTGFDFGVNAALVQSSDELIAGGAFTTFNGNTRGRIIKVLDDTERLTKGTVSGLYRDSTSSWELAGDSSAGDISGVALSITPVGQVQYTSDDIKGTLVASILKYILKLL